MLALTAHANVAGAGAKELNAALLLLLAHMPAVGSGV
jgi:hypothetical protein